MSQPLPETVFPTAAQEYKHPHCRAVRGETATGRICLVHSPYRAFVQSTVLGADPGCAVCPGRRGSARVRGLKDQARCMMGFSCLQWGAAPSPSHWSPTQFPPGETKPNKQKSLPCFLLFSLSYQLTQDVMGQLGDNKLELERKEEPQDGCMMGE